MADLYVMMLIAFALINTIQFLLCISYIIGNLKQKIIFYWHYLQIFLAVTLFSSVSLIYLSVSGGYFDPEDPTDRTFRALIYQIIHLVYLTLGIFLLTNLILNSLIIFTKWYISHQVVNFLLSWTLIIGLLFSTFYLKKENTIDSYVGYVNFGLIFLNLIILVSLCIKNKIEHFNKKQLLFLIKKCSLDLFSCGILLIIIELDINFETTHIFSNLFLIIYAHFSMTMYLRYDTTQKVHIWRFYRVFFCFSKEYMKELMDGYDDNDLFESMNGENDNNDNKIDSNENNNYKAAKLKESSKLENSPEGFYLVFLMMFSYYKTVYKKSDKKVKTSNIENVDSERSLTNQVSTNVPLSKENISPSMTKVADNNINIKDITGIPIYIKQTQVPVNKENNINNINNMTSPVEECLVSYEENSFNEENKKDKLYFDHLSSHFSRKEESSHDPNNECEIESIYKNIFEEIMPIFHLNYSSILNALDPKKNINLFNIFSENRIQEARFNGFWTKDLLLQFDIYNTNILSYTDNFMAKYRDYLLSKTQSFGYTFLPLIVGMFKVKYFNIEKVIVLYRHPYAFSTFHPLKSWYILSINDTLKSEIISSNTNNEEYAKQKDIEASDSIQLYPEDYEIFYKTFLSDLDFISSLDRFPSFKINIFTIVDVYQFMSNLNIWKSKDCDNLVGLCTSNNEDDIANIMPKPFIKNSNKNIFSKNPFNSDNNFKSNDLIDIMDNSEFYEDNNDNNNWDPKLSQNYARKYNIDSPTLSELEKVNIINKINSRYLIKIYFKNLFNVSDQVPVFEQLFNEKYLKK